jgi:segregation and condensation protein A
MASTLVEIKSRMALPQEAEAPELVEPEEDPRADLVRQLLEYKRFRDAARLLEERAHAWQQRYPRLSNDRPSNPGDPANDLIREVELWDLISALSRVLRKNSEASPETVVYDDTPIAVYIERIQSRVMAEGCVAFSALFAGSNARSRIVGIFLALLELLRHYHFRAEQPVPCHEIWILPPAAGAAGPAAGAMATADAGTGAAAPDLQT